MASNSINNAKLGLFVFAGLLFMVFSLYMIGSNRNLFGSSFTIKASFYNVDGLTVGNNVRFSGIDVGTVKAIEIESDSTIAVTMLLDKSVRKYLRQNVIASIGTDGLMGNKLININSQSGAAPLLEPGTVIQSLKPIETDAMLRTLNTTNDNIEVITQNLKSITEKLNSNNSLWTLLADTIIARDLTLAVREIREASKNTVAFTEEANYLIKEVKRGEGLAGSILTDTIVFTQLKSAVNDIVKTSGSAQQLASDLEELVQYAKQGEGTAATLLYDTTLVNRLKRSMLSVEEGTARFNENMEALKHNFLTRAYFRKQEKKNKANQK
ncbi:MCE family protein [Chryseotalea sanaruensis]|uniref:MCE family protein n=1 Tax=Chryseotalea sanaruensis TaxID=2482724 RepID=A0A401U518_9BACT|nr:MlaD family protein [Chryseotalea sanaruensis]GCC50023.1 MCE family protein [Chryseotalea sanaruensis]